MAASHKLPDDLLATAALGERFFLESEFEGASEGYWFLRQRNNGKLSAQPRLGYVPSVERIGMAHILIEKLNKELSMGGAWVVAWMNYGGKLVAIWIDGDGDARFTVEAFANELFHPVESRRLGLGELVSQCFDGWMHWKELMVDVLEPRHGVDHYRRALGEKPPSSG